MRTKSENRACRDVFNDVRGPVVIFKLHRFIDNSKRLTALLLLTASQNKKWGISYTEDCLPGGTQRDGALERWLIKLFSTKSESCQCSFSKCPWQESTTEPASTSSSIASYWGSSDHVSLEIYSYFLHTGKVLTFDFSCCCLPSSIFLFTEKYYFGSSFQEAQDRSIAYVCMRSHCNQCSTQTEHACPDQFGLRKRSKGQILLSWHLLVDRRNWVGRENYTRGRCLLYPTLHDVSSKCYCSVVKCRRPRFWWETEF